jgi:hypothetical protein
LIKEREKKMREMALDCMVKVLECLVDWYEDVTMTQTTSNRADSGICVDNEESRNSTSHLELINQFVQVKQQKSIIESGIDL